MLFNYITLFTALSISAVAIFYSVSGLAAIFAASVVPIIIMGSVLEVGKLVVAVWLHRNWQKAVWWLKTYLTIAVIILMFITSLGIFGFLSKSHIEQTSASDEQIAKIEVVDESILRLKTKIANWDNEILRFSTGNADTRVDNLVAREEASLDKINNNINKEKDRYREQANTDIVLINSNIQQAQDSLDKELTLLNAQLKNCFSCNDERQQIADAKFSFNAKETRYNNEITVIRTQLKEDLISVDTKHQPQVNTINTRINELKNQSTIKTEDIDNKILQLEQKIVDSQVVLTSRVEDRTVLESRFRKLEADVGPVKYIAEFIYGEANRSILEDAVRLVIVVIIFVFDPLAVLLLIASQYSFEQSRKKPVRTIEQAEQLEDDYVNMVGKSFLGNWHPSDGIVDHINKSESKVEPITPKKGVKKVAKKIKPTVIKVEKIAKITDVNVAVITALILEKDPRAYISYKGKSHRKSALQIAHPELITDVKSTVEFGIEFPENMSNAKLFIRTDYLPTKLYRFNSESWIQLDKNVLPESAYSRDYTKHLIKKLNDHNYDPLLLEAILDEGIGADSKTLLNDTELKNINDYK